MTQIRLAHMEFFLLLGCSFPILQSFESKSAIVGSWGPSSISLYHSLNTGLSSRLFRKLVPSRVPKIQENISRDKNQSQIEMDGKGLSEQIGTQNSRKNGLERIKKRTGTCRQFRQSLGPCKLGHTGSHDAKVKKNKHHKRRQADRFPQAAVDSHRERKETANEHSIKRNQDGGILLGKAPHLD